jgi:hypothetical protein
VGQYNSSKTRVAPVFEALFTGDPSGRTWLSKLLRLGSRSAVLAPNFNPGALPGNHPHWWGTNERGLQPPRDLLCWLVSNAHPPTSMSLWGKAESREKREKLVVRDQETIAEALRLLAGPIKQRVWYVLEGVSRPDACLEAERALLVVEGKRTERKPTSSTTWMLNRSQMLRHMDAAWEVRDTRAVVGMMIVEGSEGQEALEPSAYWIDEAQKLMSPAVLSASLPHRTLAEQKEIAAGFLGVTTWQQVCRTFGLPWPP